MEENTFTDRLTDKYAPLLVIFLAGLLLSFRLIFEGYLYGNDAPLHILWAQQFLKSFHAGEIYPRWLMDVNAGFGSPTFVFYYPFVFYTYVVINLFAKEIPNVINISAVAGLITSGLAMYAYSRLFFSRMISLIAAIAYMALPYHLHRIYHGSTMTEFWAFLWPPLVLLFTHKLRGKTSFLWTAICYAGLILTHLPTAFLFSPFVLAYIIFLFLKERNIGYLSARLLAPASGIALSAIYLLPAMMEQGYINIGVATTGIFNFRGNFLFSGFAYEPELKRMFSMAAVAELLIFIFPVFIFAFKRSLGDEFSRRIMLFASFSGIASFIMMTDVSMPIWEMLSVSQLHKVQFPTRLLTVNSVFAALCVGAGVHLITKMKGVARNLLFAAFLAIAMLNGLLSHNVILSFKKLDRSFKGYSISREMSYQELRKNYFTYFSADIPIAQALKQRSWALFLIDAGAFRPKGANPESDMANSIYTSDRQAFYTEGSGSIEVLQWKSEDRSLRAVAPEGGILLLRTFHYPGWKAYMDGNPTQIAPEPSSGLMSIHVPPGTHRIAIHYEGSMWQKLGMAVSFLTAFFLAVWGVWGKFRGHMSTSIFYFLRQVFSRFPSSP